MSRRKRSSGAQVTVGDISGVGGDVNTAGGDITTHHTTGLSAAEVRQLFDGLYSAIDSRPATSPAVKEDLKADVKDIQSAVVEATQKNEELDESFLTRRFRNILRMAPDILDVVVKTLTNPALGIAEVVKKVAAKAKEEAA